MVWPFSKIYRLQVRIAELEHQLAMARRHEYRANKYKAMLEENQRISSSLALENDRLREGLQR